MTGERDDNPDRPADPPAVTGDARGSTAANIGRDGGVVVQDDVVYGTERKGTREERERETEERKAP